MSCPRHKQWTGDRKGCIFCLCEAEQLQLQIRELLKSHPPEISGPALMYELAAHVGKHAQSERQAAELLLSAVQGMVNQIRQYGVGKEHP